MNDYTFDRVLSDIINLILDEKKDFETFKMVQIIVEDGKKYLVCGSSRNIFATGRTCKVELVAENTQELMGVFNTIVSSLSYSGTYLGEEI